MLQAGAAVVKELAQQAIRYEYMPIDTFERLAMSDPTSANGVYVTEILYRAHFAAAASIVRSVRWAQGVELALTAGLFLPTCANIRGLLESAADSHHALAGVYTTVAESRTIFNRALDKKLSDVMVSAGELESVLIHFSHARRLSKQERDQFSEDHKAKEAKSYIDGLDGYKPGEWYSWYQDLCEYAHPAASSTGYLIFSESEDSHYFSPSYEADAVKLLLAERHEHLTELLRVSLVPAMLVLKVLTYFRLAPVHVRSVRKFDFSEIPAWQKCARIMKVAVA